MMDSIRYHLWWAWHRFKPRALWIKATTYQVPVSIRYGDSATQRTWFRLPRWGQIIPHYVASVSVRCEGDDDWRSIDGIVAYDYDDRGRLAALGVGFDLPCDTFYVSDPSVVVR